ncbi:MAG: iron chelate uptake ABC transporter family permease subunit [Streptosporangiales bacterium]|nr:iron chelate uptake ABC transporter family permease subunit [Streptosporangiales bacterium]
MNTTSLRPVGWAPEGGAQPAARVSRPLLALGLGVLAVTLLATALGSLFLGSRSIGIDVVVQALVHYDPANDDHVVILTSRLPRMLAGLGVGAALGVAGAVMQGVVRNPLGDPGLLGVNAGAALAVVCAIGFLGIGNASGYVWFAFAGAALVALLVYAVGSLGRDGATPVKLALAGAAVSAALTSVTTAVLLTDAATFDQFRFWTVGALTGRKLELVGRLAPFLVVGLVVALCTGRALNVLSLGDDVARALGQRVGRTRGVVAASAVVLCGAATALAGPIPFVGLVAPHAARLVTGPDYRWILPYSAVLAPLLLLLADVLGRLVARPGEVQVGIVLAFVGAPFLILLIRRRRLLEL